MPLTELPNRAPPDLVTNGRNWEWLRGQQFDLTDLNLTGLTGDVTVTAAGVTVIGAGVIVDADVNASAAIAASKLDPKLTQSTVENLKVIRGIVTAAGAVSTGSGFSVARNSAGNYTVTFTAAFSATPAVTVSPGGTASIVIALVASPTTSSVNVQTYTSSVVATDGIFHFTAIGPR